MIWQKNKDNDDSFGKYSRNSLKYEQNNLGWVEVLGQYGLSVIVLIKKWYEYFTNNSNLTYWYNTLVGPGITM